MALRAAAFLALALGLLACGGHGGGTADAGDASRPHDAATDRLTEDGPDGAPADGGPDVGPRTAPQFLTPTAGGASLESTNYRLQLFVAPAPPAGDTKSATRRLQLGPGALRNAR